MKRKRSEGSSGSAKKRCLLSDKALGRPVIELVRRYYCHVSTLREYLLHKLPLDAKKRRRIVLNHGRLTPGDLENDLLDNIIVGCPGDLAASDLEDIVNELSIPTQQLPGSTVRPGSTPQRKELSDIIDHCTTILRRQAAGEWKGLHLLCTRSGLSDVQQQQDPQHQRIRAFRAHPWSILPSLLGSRSNEILCSLFLQCGLFRYTSDGMNLLQISGVPMSDLAEAISTDQHTATGPVKGVIASSCKKTLSLVDIPILRHRMLYGRPSRHLNPDQLGDKTDGRATKTTSWTIHYGLPQKHVLSQLRCIEDQAETLRVAKHIFPREFGLANVHNCKDIKAVALRTYEEVNAQIDEDSRKRLARRQVRQSSNKDKFDLPRRLRGEPMKMLLRVRTHHSRARWWAIFQHYCPAPKGISETNSVALATPHSQVSSFCRAAVFNVFGPATFGRRNANVIERKIDQFVRLRRRETISLHNLLDGVSVAEVPWLVPRGITPSAKMSRSDFLKRSQLLAEFLYYLFESFLIPLIKAQFHVTDTRDHSNRLFYYRHEIFEAMCTPAIKVLKHNVLEECDVDVAPSSLDINFVRLVPKDQGMRPIINLRRHGSTLRNGKRMNGTSVNSRLQPAFQVLNFERHQSPAALGSGIFSINEILPQLERYKTSLRDQRLDHLPLYFAKIDVQACFDSLPHAKLMILIETMLRREEYAIKRFGRGKLLGGGNQLTPGFGAKPKWSWPTKASEHPQPIEHFISTFMQEGGTNSVYIDGRLQPPQNRITVLRSLRAHIQENYVGIGGRVYRQKVGIAQGSVVSTLLCTLLYGQMEETMLAFTDRADTKLLRLVDDFLLISPIQEVAERFVRTMHCGIAEFGVRIKPEKTRLNFDMMLDGTALRRTASVADFPYCAYTINTITLDLGRDLERAKQGNVGDTVNVEHSKLPGQSFYRKTLGTVLLLMRSIIVSSSHNAISTVLANVFHFFRGLAQKSYHYVRSLPVCRQPSAALLIKTMDDAIKLAHRIVVRHRPRDKVAAIGTAHIRWLACAAFINVLQQRQTKHRVLLAWAHKQMEYKTLVRLAPELLPIIGRSS